MRNMRLSELRKKSNKYFRNIRLNNKSSKRLVEYTIRRAYDSLPSYAKKLLETDKEKYIANAINTSLQSDKEYSPYRALRSVAQSLSGKTSQALIVFRRFRELEPSIYAKYNSYMFRNGYSASQQFYGNSRWNSKGSRVYIITELPERSKGVHYNYLLIEYDFSGPSYLKAKLV